MHYRLFLLFPILAAGLSVPALADWNEVGRLHVSPNGVRFPRDLPMGGPVEGLSLTAADDDVFCRSVRVDFGNGANREIFRGVLRQGHAANVEVPDRRNITNLSFQCRSEHRHGATIRVAADVGHYRDTWRRNPAFTRLWSRAFNWGSNLVNDWQLLGSQDFAGHGDTENQFAGWRGKHIDALALKPIGANARCSRVVARFGNGRDRALDVNRGDILDQNQFYKLDLPGDFRNLESLRLRCRPMEARRVTIQIYTSR